MGETRHLKDGYKYDNGASYVFFLTCMASANNGKHHMEEVGEVSIDSVAALLP